MTSLQRLQETVDRQLHEMGEVIITTITLVQDCPLRQKQEVEKIADADRARLKQLIASNQPILNRVLVAPKREQVKLLKIVSQNYANVLDSLQKSSQAIRAKIAELQRLEEN